MADIDIRLRIRDAARFRMELDKSGKSGKKFGVAMEASGKAAKTAVSPLRNLAKSALGVGAAYASISGAKNAIAVTSELGKSTARLSSLTGLDEKQASRWVNTAKIRGVESKALNVGFVSLARNMHNASKGGENQLRTFRRLGIFQRDLRKGDINSLLLKTADSFNKLGPGAKRTALAQQVFGRQSQTLISLLGKGRKSLQEQLSLSDKYGATLDKNQVKKVLAAAAAQREMRLAIMGIQIAFATHVLPVLTKVTGRLAGFIGRMRQSKGVAGIIGTALRTFGQIVGFLVDKFKSLTPAIKIVVVALGALGAIFLASPIGAMIATLAVGAVLIVRNWGRITPVFKKAGGAVASFLRPVGQWFAGAFNTIKKSLGIGKSDVSQFGKALSNIFKFVKTVLMIFAGVFRWVFMKIVLPIARRALPGVVDIVKGTFKIIGGVIKVFSGLFTGDFKKMWEGIKQIFSGELQRLVGIIKIATAPIRAAAALVGRVLVAGFSKAWKAIKRATSAVLGFIKKHWRTIISIVGGPVGLMVALVSKHWGKLKSAASSVWKFVHSKFSALVNFFKSLPGKIGSAASGMFDGVKNAFKSAVNWIISKWNGLSFSIGGTDLGPFGHLPKTTLSTPHIPPLFGGGFIPAGATGSFTTGERGRELQTVTPKGIAVQPLSALPAGAGAPVGGGGVQFLTPVQLVVDGRVLAETVGRSVARREARK